MDGGTAWGDEEPSTLKLANSIGEEEDHRKVSCMIAEAFSNDILASDSLHWPPDQSRAFGLEAFRLTFAS